MTDPQEHDDEARYLGQLEDEWLGSMDQVLAHINTAVMFWPHVLRQHLGAVERWLPRLELKLRERPELPPWLAAGLAVVRQRLREVNDGCSRMYDVLHDTRALWSGERLESPVPVDLHASLDAVLRLVQGTLAHTARLEKDYAPQLSPVPGLQRVFSHVLFRVVLNALRLMWPGDPQRHVLRICTREEQGWVRVTVSAKARGHRMRVQNRRFEVLSRLPHGGSGGWLDLTLSQELIESMGGELWLETPDGTPLFCLRLPVEEEARKEARRLPLPRRISRVLERSEEVRAVLQRDRRDAMRALASCFADNLRPFAGALRPQLEYGLARLDAVGHELRAAPGLQEECRRLRGLLADFLEDASYLNELLRDMRHLVYRQKERSVPLQLHASLDAALHSMSGELEQTARLEKHYEPSLPQVSGSEGHVQRMFRHIIGYALHAMKQSPPGPHVLRVRTRCEHGWVRVEISDSSRGVPSQERASMLDPFFLPRLMWSGNFYPGLGLSMSEALVTAMRGELLVESQEGVGNTFTVSLMAN